MATATFRFSRKERSSDRGRGFFDRFLVRAGHDVALDLRSEAWETKVGGYHPKGEFAGPRILALPMSKIAWAL